MTGADTGAGAPPLVTAIVPCYRSAAFIDRTLACLDAQTWPNLEILIGDDASPDDTLAHLYAFAEGRTDTRIIERQTNLGWLANTNDLIAEARGELMFFAFHDDVVAPEYVERLAAALEAAPDAVLAYCDVEMHEISGEVWAASFHDLDGVGSATRRALIMAREPERWWVPNRGLFRASAARAVGGIRRPRASELNADWVWLLELAMQGRFVSVPGQMCQKYYKKTSISQVWTRSGARSRDNVASTRMAGLRGVMAGPLPASGKALVGAALAGRTVSRYLGRSAAELLRARREKPG